MNIWLAQYLCPRRHAIVALPYDRDARTEAEVEADIRRSIVGVLNPWCGLCASRELHFEHNKLRYTDWEEANAALDACALDQALTQFFVKQQHDDN